MAVDHALPAKRNESARAMSERIPPDFALCAAGRHTAFHRRTAMSSFNAHHAPAAFRVPGAWRCSPPAAAPPGTGRANARRDPPTPSAGRTDLLRVLDLLIELFNAEHTALENRVAIRRGRNAPTSCDASSATSGTRPTSLPCPIRATWVTAISGRCSRGLATGASPRHHPDLLSLRGPPVGWALRLIRKPGYFAIGAGRASAP